MGFIEQSSSRSPRTFLGAFGRPPPFPLSSLSIADPWTAVTSPIPATASRRQWAPALVLGVEESTQAPVAAAHVSNRQLYQDQISARLARAEPDNGVITVVRDATADYSDEAMHAALDIDIPNYASAIVSAEEIVASMRAL